MVTIPASSSTIVFFLQKLGFGKNCEFHGGSVIMNMPFGSIWIVFPIQTLQNGCVQVQKWGIYPKNLVLLMGKIGF